MLALLRVSRLRRIAQKAGLSDVVVMGSNLRLAGRDLLDSKQLRLQRMYPGSKWWGQTRTAQVPLPKDVSDDDLITWVGSVLENLYDVSVEVSVDAEGATSGSDAG